MTQYVPLQVLGGHSLLRGTFMPGALVDAASRLGLKAVALTDRNSLMGATAFVKAARAAGVRPVLGVDFEHAGVRLTLLARGTKGYRACCALISAQAAGRMQDPALAVAEKAQDLMVLCADPRLLARMHGLIGPESLRAAVVRLPGRAPNALRSAASDLGVRCVSAGEVHLLTSADHEVHRLLRAIGQKTVLERLSPEDVVPAEAVLLDASSMAARHRGEEELLRESLALADIATAELELGTPHLPRWSGEGDPDLELEALMRAAMTRRYGAFAPMAVEERLQRELSVIRQLGFARYFLVVNTIASFARERGIPFVGRGSAANSLVIYLLGITRVDPLVHELVFERFLSPSRRSLPDVDIDFCWRRRDEVLAFVHRRWGAEQVALIATAIRLRPRLAFREAAAALGLPRTLLGRVAEVLPWHWEGEPEELPELKPLLAQPEVQRACSLAMRLTRLPRHLGLHPGGMVIADRTLDHYTAVVPSAKGPPMTQNDKDGIEALGLVKIDLLGQRSLSTIGEARDLLRKSGTPLLEEGALPDADEAVAELLAEGRTLGCFQTESPAMRRLLVEMRARTRSEVTDAIALVRPGASGSGMKERYVRRARGLEAVEFPHPLLASVLGRTQGVMLYQEDILRVCAALAGFSVEEGDEVRAALGKRKDPQRLQELAQRYTAGALRSGVSPETAAEVWTRIGNFAAFSFCKAHAATYGDLAWEELWLKARYPLAFFCAVLNNERGYYEDRVYLDEARRMGVRFLLPDVNKSHVGFREERGALRIGLGRIKGLRSSVLEELLRSREQEGAFVSFSELLQRVALQRPEAESLVRCGALDAFEHARPELLWRLRLHGTKVGEATHEASLFAPLPRATLPRVPDFSPERKHRDEYELLGLNAEGGEAVFGATPERLSVATVRGRIGEEVLCRGWVSASRRLRAQDGRFLRFLSVEDASGMLEALVPPEQVVQAGLVLRGEGPFLFRGRMELRLGVPCLRVTGIRPVEEAGEERASYAGDRT
jgi:DNA-directed DNA polymerase III PolC